MPVFGPVSHLSPVHMQIDRLLQDYNPDKLNESIKAMIGAGMTVSMVAWHTAFMRQVTIPMEAGEWDAWLVEMEAGHAQIAEDDLKTLRCSCAVRAVMSLLEATPDTKDQCRDTWQAILSLIDKILVTNWFNASPKAFQEEMVNVRSMFVLGVQMHHSNQEEQGKAEAYKKTFQTSPSKSSLYFSKLLTQSSAGVQLGVAVSDVLVAGEKVAGWQTELRGAVESLSALPELLEENFLNKDNDIVVPHSSKVAEISSKLLCISQNSTDKFQEENGEDIKKLKALQETVAKSIQKAMAKRAFVKVPSLGEAISWVADGCPAGSDYASHVNALVASKTIVLVKTNFSKHVGAESAKLLQEFSNDFSKFLAGLEGFCSWVAEANKNEESLAFFSQDAFVEWVKFLQQDQDTSGQHNLKFFVSSVHTDGLSWHSRMKEWLVTWSQKRIVAKVASCKDFVGLVMQEGVEVEKICQESIAGAVDHEEEIGVVVASCREFSVVSTAVCFDESMCKPFAFEDLQIDMQNLILARIFLPAARYTAALVVSGSKIACKKFTDLQSQTVDQMKQGGQSRTESTTNFLSITKKWVEAFMGFMGVRLLLIIQKSQYHYEII